MKTSRSLFMTSRPAICFLFLLIVSQSAQAALHFCLYARSNGNPTSGHASVTIEDSQGKVHETYGYWPKEKYPQSLTVNIPADNPLRVIKARWGLTPEQEQMSEVRLCQSMGGLTIAQVRKAVLSYPQVRGAYRYFDNNCSHFAVTMYNAVTKDSFPVVATPGAIRREVRKVAQAGAKSYNEYRRLTGR